METADRTAFTRPGPVRDWCANNPGNWEVFSYDNPNPGYYPLVSSGKAGTTACHFAVSGGNGLTSIGTDDVRDWATFDNAAEPAEPQLPQRDS